MTNPMSISPELESKYNKLQEILRACGGVMVAYSGGVDSTFLAYAAQQALGSRAIAVTAVSETYPKSELNDAVAFAKQLNLNHRIIQTSELQSEGFAGNPPDRCYYCKQELFKKLGAMADKENIPYVLDGTTVTDGTDFRPGQRAAAELKVCSPLKEAGLTKEEVRQLSRLFGVPTWDKPAYACLASRLPYGENITPAKLQRVEQAEDFLMGLGFKVCRVRSHRYKSEFVTNEVNLARIEIEPDRLPLLVQHKDQIVRKLQQLGYDYVTVDLEGYRSGSMNRNISREEYIDVETDAATEAADEIQEVKVIDSYLACPDCRDNELDEIITRPGHYKQCGHCGGVWFNVNELEKALGQRVKFNIPSEVRAATGSPESVRKNSGKSACPLCQTPLVRIKSIDAPDMEIAACMICQGRWVAGAEIARLQDKGLFAQIKTFVMRLF